MQWDSTPNGGFSQGTPWLPAVDPGERNVAAQRGDATSLLTLYRELIALRRRLDPGFELLDAPDGVVAWRRGDHAIAINTTAGARPSPVTGDVVFETGPVDTAGELGPHTGVVVA